MANITRIKAGESSKQHEEPAKEPKKPSRPAVKEKAPEEAKPAQPQKENPKASTKAEQKAAQKAAKNAKKAEKAAKKSGEKKPFILFRPFITFAHYLRDSWAEIRQVRWPSRKATWQMFFAVILYSALFIVLITLLDLFFAWLFNLILGK